MRHRLPLREPPPWEEPDWDRATDGWIQEQLDRQGLRRTGPMEARPRPWSIVLSIPTSGGTCFFKMTAREMANDAALTDLLARETPGLVLTPLAVDADRRWMLLPDGGRRLRDVMADRADIGHWQRILPAYAQLQRQMQGRETELTASGALDRRPRLLPDLFNGLIDDGEWLTFGRGEGLTTGQLGALRKLRPRLVDACAEVEASGIGSSIQHDDLHDGNVVSGADGYRIIDWGDAALTHPFATLLVTLRWVAHSFELGEWTPFGPAIAEIDRLRDAYLEAWSDVLPHDRLVELVRIATWTGMLGRALTWRAARLHATDAELADSASAVSGWLKELLASAPG
jgi:Phosphotransferase enzyme family